MALALFLAFLALYCTTALGRIDSYDGDMMFRVAESIVLRGSVQIVDDVFHASEPYSLFGIGTSLGLVPFYGAARVIGVQPEWLASFLNPLVTAATVALTYRLALAIDLSRRLALAAALGLGLATLAWPYAKTTFSEPLTALCLVVAALAARNQHAVALGLALGLAVLTRTDSLLVAPLFALYIGRWHARQLRIAAIAFVPLAGAAVAYHFVRFGGVVGNYSQRSGAELLLEPNHIANAIYGQLFSSGKGVVLYAPLVLLTLPGLSRFHATLPKEALLFGALIVERLVFFSLHSRWWGGIVWGPRYLVSALPFALIAAAYYLREQETPTRWLLFAALFAAGLVAALAGVSTFYTDGLDVVMGRGASWEEILWVPRFSPLRVHVERMLRGEATGWLVPPPPAGPNA